MAKLWEKYALKDIKLMDGRLDLTILRRTKSLHVKERTGYYYEKNISA